MFFLFKVYEVKGKEFYYDEFFSKDKDVFIKKVIEKNVFYFVKMLDMLFIDVRFKLMF